MSRSDRSCKLTFPPSLLLPLPFLSNLQADLLCSTSPPQHLRQMLVVGESAGKYIDDFSKNFMDEFILLLSRRFVLSSPLLLLLLSSSRLIFPFFSLSLSIVGTLRYNTKRIRANQVYQEYIQDKEHIHMNSTKWVTLTEFVKYLGKEGIVRVDETEKGFFISWVDNSPGALARQVSLAFSVFVLERARPSLVAPSSLCSLLSLPRLSS